MDSLVLWNFEQVQESRDCKIWTKDIYFIHISSKNKSIYDMGTWCLVFNCSFRLASCHHIHPSSPTLDYKHFDLPKVENTWNLCRIQFEVKFKHPIFKPINQTLTCNTKRSNWSPSYTWLAGNAHDTHWKDVCFHAIEHDNGYSWYFLCEILHCCK
jgi:hypothetical protein